MSGMEADSIYSGGELRGTCAQYTERLLQGTKGCAHAIAGLRPGSAADTSSAMPIYREGSARCDMPGCTESRCLIGLVFKGASRLCRTSAQKRASNWRIYDEMKRLPAQRHA